MLDQEDHHNVGNISLQHIQTLDNAVKQLGLDVHPWRYYTRSRQGDTYYTKTATYIAKKGINMIQQELNQQNQPKISNMNDLAIIKFVEAENESGNTIQKSDLKD